MEWIPCGETYANALFCRIGVLAYNLFLAFKLLSPGRVCRSSTIATSRWHLFQVAGQAVRHAHRLVLKVVASLEKLKLSHQVRRRCYELALA